MAYFDELSQRHQDYLNSCVAVRFTGTREDILSEVFGVDDESELEGHGPENFASAQRWLLGEDPGLAAEGDWNVPNRVTEKWIWVQYGDYRTAADFTYADAPYEDAPQQGDWDVFGIPRKMLEKVE